MLYTALGTSSGGSSLLSGCKWGLEHEPLCMFCPPNVALRLHEEHLIDTKSF